MISQRLKQVRLARGLSLEALAAKMGGLVTKQALSKYEHDKAKPSRQVLVKLAAALQVDAAYLWSEPTITVELTAYRKRARLPKKEQERIEHLVCHLLEERVRLQMRIHQRHSMDLPLKAFKVKCLEDADRAADELRGRWNLGMDPIASVVDVLEAHHIHVLEIDTDDRFDGIASVAYDSQRKSISATVVARRGLPGERQRLDFLHELGHLVLDVQSGCDEEKAAFRFGAAFLAPAEILFQEIGTKRLSVLPQELLLFKKRYGMSVQSLLYRLKDLSIITASSYRQWCIDINRLGWRKNEPLDRPPEQPIWLRQSVLRAVSEGLITADEVKDILGEDIDSGQPLTLIQRKALMQLPLEERRRILADQADRIATQYETPSDWQALEGEDVVEY
jgi:transcriptional regulator with XRE-family HTH domain